MVLSFFLSLSVSFFSRYYAAPLISYDFLVLGGPVMGRGGTITVPHVTVLSSFAATMGKVTRAAAEGGSFRTLTTL